MMDSGSLIFTTPSRRSEDRRISFYGGNKPAPGNATFRPGRKHSSAQSSRIRQTYSSKENNYVTSEGILDDVTADDSDIEGDHSGNESDGIVDHSPNIHDSMYTFEPTQVLSDSPTLNSGRSQQQPSNNSSILSGSSAFNSRRNQQTSSGCGASVQSQVLPQSPDILCLLQQQQKLLSEVLSEQKEIKETQKSFSKRVSTMERQITNVEQSMNSSSTGSSSPNSTRRKPRRITRDLSTKVSKVHDNLKDQFKPSESSTSNYNKEVKRTIIREVRQATSFTESQIIVAVKRKYESLRRLWIAEGKEDFEQNSITESIKKKNRQRRRRKFDARQCMVKEEEMKYWEQISIEYMTEESDDLSDPNTIIEHKLTWRSKDLEEFLSRLDQRYQMKVSREGGTVAKKVRKEGALSTSTPPDDAPTWTVKPEQRNGGDRR